MSVELSAAREFYDWFMGKSASSFLLALECRNLLNFARVRDFWCFFGGIILPPERCLCSVFRERELSAAPLLLSER